MECKKCGSTKIMKNITITDFSHGNVEKDLSIKVKKTNRMFFNKYTKATILADICGNCGNLELQINNPKELWETYSKK